jgi:hypothetical protein
MNHPIYLLSWATVLNTILYENEFQNHQIFQQTIGLFPEHSTLVDLAEYSEKYNGICINILNENVFQNPQIFV